MKRTLSYLVVILVAAATGACGDDTPATFDAAPQCEDVGGEPCFELPTAPLTIDQAGTAANFNCAAYTITSSDHEITVNGVAEDFQYGDPLEAATIDAFDDLDFANPGATATSAADGTFTLILPTGSPSRMNWRTRHADGLDTFALNEPIDITLATETVTRQVVSNATATLLPAFIGISRTEGLGVLAGAVEDCDGNEVAGAIATISTTSSAGDAWPTFQPGARVYYFSDGDPDLPIHRNQEKMTRLDGMFVILEIPPTTGTQTYYLQVWGFPTAAAMGQGAEGLRLLSEFEAPVVGDSVISITMSPNQGAL